MLIQNFQKRIGLSGDITPLLLRVCEQYRLGSYISHSVIPVGYEDFNLILKTSKNKYFVKVFASYRSDANCERYVDIIRAVLSKRISHPKLYRPPQGFIFRTTVRKIIVRLAIMQYIDSRSLYETGVKLSPNDAKFLIWQAARISKIKLKPSFIYDSWAVSNFLKEHKKKKKFLATSDRKVIADLAHKFSKLSLRKLPYSLVHGDIIKTNVLKDKRGKLFIIDFSVANYYPRIQELAVLLCSVLFNEKHPDIKRMQRFVLHEYQKYVGLTEYELKAFPLYCEAAHAMHVLEASYAKAKGNMSRENDYWLRLGRIGLRASQ